LRWTSWAGYEVTRSGNNVLLIGDSVRRELEAVPPVDRLLVVHVGPERMEDIVGANRNITVIAKEPAPETVAAVNWVCR
jgi:hypothetical protein